MRNDKLSVRLYNCENILLSSKIKKNYENIQAPLNCEQRNVEGKGR